MTSLDRSTHPLQTLAELVEQLGGIPLSRIRLQPAPGTATEADVLALEQREKRLCELVDGVLVEKAASFKESCLAGAVLALLREFVVPRNLGLVSVADGMVRLFPNLVRIPDVAFVTWERIPGGRMPADAIPQLAPDLAVEVLSPGNTGAEMARKRHEYFRAGVRLVWLVDPEARSVTVYTAPEQSRRFDEDQELDGGAVLPGFTHPVRSLFTELDRRAGV